METGKHIPSWAQSTFSQSDLARIDAAIVDFEKRTLAEIVPVICSSSTPIQGAKVMIIVLALIGALAVEVFVLNSLDPLVLTGTFLGGAAAGFLLARSEMLLRFVLPDDDEIQSVHQRAELEFYRRNLSKTTHQTGILFFLSLFERRVVVLVDKGLMGHMNQQELDQITQALVQALKAGRGGEGLLKAIQSFLKLVPEPLTRKSYESLNELPNRVVFANY